VATTPGELIHWLKDRPVWLQEALRRLQAKGTLTSEDDAELLTICKNKSAPAPTLTEQMLNFKVATNTVLLKSLSDPKGIDQLSPKKTLDFHDQLTIVYGNNGCGKSGYVRILKSICGARSAKKLSGNVFDAAEVAQSCKIAFSLNGAIGPAATWSPKDGPHADLRCVEVYDTDGGALYTTKENEVLFEPPLLSLVQQIINAAGRIQGLLDSEIAQMASKKPEMPSAHAGTEVGIWYPNVKASTTDGAIDRECTWRPEDEEKLADLNRRLAEANPAEEAKKQRKLKKGVEEFTTHLKGLRTALDDAHAQAIATARASAKNARQAATEDAKKVFAQAPLSGVGQESWKRLWEAARIYSTTVAYIGAAYPKTDDAAKCVLCQQELSTEAKERLTAFETFVRGKLEKDAKLAEASLDQLLEVVPKLEAPQAFTTRLDSVQINDEAARETLTKFHGALAAMAKSILDDKPLEPLPLGNDFSLLETLAIGLEDKAKKLDEDARAEGKEALRSEAKALAARKWVSEQRTAIIAERNRLKDVAALDTARKTLNTKALSDKKTALTNELITEAFVARFQAELKALGTPRLKVTIKKTDTRKGQVLHQVQLIAAHGDAKTGSILSEGEARVVSLAAFLADSEGGDATAPFIFDDPISSLDQDFEEAAVRRLIALAKKRQVIVFTHRISLLTFLRDMAKAEGIEPLVVGLRKEPWGTGEPSTPPLFSMKPAQAINLLINDRVPRARKALAEGGNEAYDIQAKAICSEIRIVIESLVESTLLNGIVTRFRRAVNTMGKLDKLAEIKPDDCKFLDDMMTEYSKYEHSQSDEAPVAPPDADNLVEDLMKLKTWEAEFSKR
jgi:energy-coupling factor transporter ATP-binding protein EcfA2